VPNQPTVLFDKQIGAVHCGRVLRRIFVALQSDIYHFGKVQVMFLPVLVL
jgi:hypothetical protein